MALARGQSSQSEGKPIRLGLSPDMVTLSSQSQAQVVTSNITEISGVPISLGQNTKVNSLPVTVASDQGALSVTPTVIVNHYNHISTNTTTTVKSGAGVLVGILVNTEGASNNTATVYDNTSATSPIIAVIDTTKQTELFLYNLNFTTGLTIVTATGTAPDLTVVYQ